MPDLTPHCLVHVKSLPDTKLLVIKATEYGSGMLLVEVLSHNLLSRAE